MKFSIFKRLTFLGAILAILTLGGCATVKPPALSDEVKAIDTTKASIGFMTVKIANKVNTYYQPELKYAFIWSEESNNEDVEKFSIEVSDPYETKSNEYFKYLVSFQLDPGTYVINELFAQSGIFPVVGTFAVPMYRTVTIPANKVMYLGHIDATVVDKTDDDTPSAGPIVPLIDQAVTGASVGTFDIQISDQYETDTQLVQQMFSYMKDVKVENYSLDKIVQPISTASE